MAPMGQHDLHSAAGRPLRRAHRAAWFTFIFMAGTTITFQTYHSVQTGKMPWPLAVLYGIAAFILAITVLEFARHGPKWVQAGAYLLTAGAMYLSASATGDVTINAAPPHAELLFGFLLDGAAILAIYFIFNGPSAAQAVAEVAHREAELTAAVTASREALDRAVTDHRKSLEEAEAAHRKSSDEAEAGYRAAAAAAQERYRAATARLAEENAAGQRNLGNELDQLRAELRTARRDAEDRQAEAMRVHRMTADAIQKRADDARADAEAATAKADRLERKLTAVTGSGKGGSGTRKPAPVTAPVRPEAPAVNPDDLPGDWGDWDTEARVLFLVNEKGFSASKAGVEAGVTDARGRQIARMAKDLGGTAPQDVVGETPES